MKFYELPTYNTKADAIILANGLFPTNKIALSILQNSNYVVCCDGAIDQLNDHNIEPQAIVGDCDSLSDENRLKYKDIIHRVTEQDTNDLTKTVNFCFSQSKKNIIILGATGKRDDHTIGNISLLSEYIDKTNTIAMITDYGVFNAANNCNSQFESFAGQQVSLFSITNSPITTENLKFEIKNQIFTNWWQATLNESLADYFVVDTQGKIIIYRAF